MWENADQNNSEYGLFLRHDYLGDSLTKLTLSLRFQFFLQSEGHQEHQPLRLSATLLKEGLYQRYFPRSFRKF